MLSSLSLLLSEPPNESFLLLTLIDVQVPDAERGEERSFGSSSGHQTIQAAELVELRDHCEHLLSLNAALLSENKDLKKTARQAADRVSTVELSLDQLTVPSPPSSLFLLLLFIIIEHA